MVDELLKEAYQVAQPRVPREFLDDSAAVLLYAGNNYLVEKDGTLETVTHEVTRLNGRKGVEKLGERSIVSRGDDWWTAWRQFFF